MSTGVVNELPLLVFVSSLSYVKAFPNVTRFNCSLTGLLKSIGADDDFKKTIIPWLTSFCINFSEHWIPNIYIYINECIWIIRDN